VGIWLDRRTVRRPSAHDASTLRGSIGLGATRWLTISSVMRCAAPSNAVFTAAASPWRISAETLSGASLSSGAPGLSALSASTTAGSSSYSISTASPAARAASRDSATTITTDSPT
jgi:hypothetical protein